MHYKLYRYQLEMPTGKAIYVNKHFSEFSKAKGPDEFGDLSPYRRKKDSILMYLRDFHYDFIGLIGWHSTEREVSTYDNAEDLVEQLNVGDDDYVCTKTWGLIELIRNLTWHYEEYQRLLAEDRAKNRQ